ncbi:YIP1 family protein [Candidatus Woesearchaeota archaeon]|nr:YIP1 family protein [Candidatus Woesearchaeota archaeon]
MVNQKLIEWINSKETKGYTEKQLRDFLIKKKYKKEDIDGALKYVENKKSEASQKFDFWDKLKYLFSNPKLFFDNIKEEKEIYHSVIALLVVYLAVAAAQYGLSFMLLRAVAGPFRYMAMGFFGLLGPFMLILMPIIALLLGGLYAALVHLVVIIFSGQGRYTETFKAYAYSFIPAAMFGLIPVAGFLGYLYALVLMTIGISRQHNITYGKSAIAVLTPIFLIIGLLAILALFIFRTLIRF